MIKVGDIVTIVDEIEDWDQSPRVVYPMDQYFGKTGKVAYISLGGYLELDIIPGYYWHQSWVIKNKWLSITI